MTTAEPPETCLPNYSYTFQRDVLRGKVAFITGGGTGICFTIAEVFMRHQCNVVIASRRLEKLRAAAQTLERETGMRCLAVQMDVRKPEAILKAVDEALSAFGKIDILVNGAAGNFLCPVDSMSFNAFRTVMDIDTNGTFNVTKAVYDKWLKAHGGVIINITATLQVRGQALQTHAGSAKAAIEAMTRHMAVEMGPRNIRVMCVAPGPITNTEGFRKLGGGSLPGDAEVFQDIPIGRAGERVEIADVCLFLCTPAAVLLTGTTVIADGGAWLTSMNGMKRYASLMAAAQASKSKL